MTSSSIKIITSEPSTLQHFVQAFLKYRHLLSLLIWRDMNVRYRQTSVGLLWVLLQPVITALIFTLIFGHMAKLPADGLPYLVFAYSGAVIWRFFAQGVERSSNSILAEAGMITKVYFPRWILPLAQIGGSFFDLLISLLILFVLVWGTGLSPGYHLLLLPLAVFLIVILTAFSAVSVALLCCKYRDFVFVVSFALQLFQFLTPVFYSASLFGDKLRVLAYLNPLTGLFELFRLSVTGRSHFWLPGFLISMAVDLILILIACRIVYLLEDELVDVI